MVRTIWNASGLFVHMVDVVQWYLGITKPSAVDALGGIYQYDDGRDTPDNINVVAEYAEKMTVTFEATVTDMVQPESADIVFLGSGGRLQIFRYGYRFLSRDAKSAADAIVVKGTPDQHMQNWIDCIRSRKDPNATVEQGPMGHSLAVAARQGGTFLPVAEDHGVHDQHDQAQANGERGEAEAAPELDGEVGRSGH